MNSLFKALNDPTRRRILEMLRARDMTAGEIAEAFDMTKPSISHHLDLVMIANVFRIKFWMHKWLLCASIAVALAGISVDFADAKQWRKGKFHKHSNSHIKSHKKSRVIFIFKNTGQQNSGQYENECPANFNCGVRIYSNNTGPRIIQIESGQNGRLDDKGPRVIQFED